MATVDAVDSGLLLKSTIDRPFIRTILKYLSKKCRRDNKNRLEVALEQFVGVREVACFTCSHIVAPILRWVLRKGGAAFGVTESQLQGRFQSPYARRALVSVVQGIAKFGSRIPFVPGAPFLVVWDLTNQCNLHCKHCYASAGTARNDELSTQEAFRAIDALNETGVSIVAFSGGEPLIRKDFFDLVARAHDCGLFTAVATNGSLLNRNLVKKLKAAQIGYVQISLDGATPHTHDTFRGVPGMFQKTLQGIQTCLTEGLFVEIATTGTKFNYHEFPRIIKLCRTLGVHWFMHYNFVPTGRGNFMEAYDLSPEEREDLLELLLHENETRDMPLLSTAPQFVRVSLQAFPSTEEEVLIPGHFYNARLSGKLQNLSEFIGGCGAGRFYAALRANGDIDPCVFLPKTVGNIRKDSFEELWEHCEVFETLRDRSRLEGFCGDCDFKFRCGGCRARAYGYFHRLTAPDPGCIRNIDVYHTLVSRELLERQNMVKTPI